MDITIHQAILSDAGAIAGLLGEMGYPATSADVVDRLRAVETTSSDVVLVAASDAQVVAFLSLHVMRYFTTGYLVGRVLAMAVTEEVRGRGIGRRLMQAAEEQARLMGCKAVEVTSANHREGAHAFYAKLGYPKSSAKFLKFLDEPAE